MKFSVPRSLLVVTIIASLLGTSGCHEWVALRPAELGKLQMGMSIPVAQEGNTTVAVVRVQAVTTEEGRLHEIKGDYDLRITTQSGKEEEFSHPILVKEAPPSGYAIQSGNRSTRVYQMEQIKKVEVSRFDVSQTVLASLGASAGVFALVFGLLALSK